MANVAIQLADAVVASLNAATFSPTFTAVRHYTPQFNLLDLGAVHVIVVPKSATETVNTRSTTQNEYQIDVGIHQNVDTTDLSAIDTLMSLVQDVSDHFRFTTLATMTSAHWVRTECSPIYSADHLLNNQEFTSVLTLTYKLQR